LKRVVSHFDLVHECPVALTAKTLQMGAAGTPNVPRYSRNQHNKNTTNRNDKLNNHFVLN
jgi:hypothetical protein